MIVINGYAILYSLNPGEQVTKGNVAVKAKYGIIPVYSGNLDLCTLGQEAGLPCPVAAGDHTVTLNEAIPSAIPSVSIAV